MFPTSLFYMPFSSPQPSAMCYMLPPASRHAMCHPLLTVFHQYFAWCQCAGDPSTCYWPFPVPAHGQGPAICSAMCQHIGNDLLFTPPCTNAWAMTHYLLCPVQAHGRESAICSALCQHMGKGLPLCSTLCQHMGDDLQIALPCTNTWVTIHYLLHPVQVHGR